MMAKMPEQYPNRPEKLARVLADGRTSIKKLIAELAQTNRFGFERLRKQSVRRAGRMPQQTKQNRARREPIDERIDKLVLDIREFIRRGT
jgi:hypothetical protein